MASCTKNIYIAHIFILMHGELVLGARRSSAYPNINKKKKKKKKIQEGGG